MSVYEDNIIPIKIAHLAEYVSKVKRISLDDALVYIYVNPMYPRLYDEEARRKFGGSRGDEDFFV